MDLLKVVEHVALCNMEHIVQCHMEQISMLPTPEVTGSAARGA